MKVLWILPAHLEISYTEISLLFSPSFAPRDQTINYSYIINQKWWWYPMSSIVNNLIICYPFSFLFSLKKKNKQDTQVERKGQTDRQAEEVNKGLYSRRYIHCYACPSSRGEVGFVHCCLLHSALRISSSFNYHSLAEAYPLELKMRIGKAY